MITEIASKSELLSLAAKLETEAAELQSTVDSIKSSLGSVSSYDGIDAASAANILSANLSSIVADLETAARNINSYVNEVNNFDVDDLTKTEETEENSDIVEENIITNSTTSTEETTSSNTTTNIGTTAGVTSAIIGGMNNSEGTTSNFSTSSRPSSGSSSSSVSNNTGNHTTTSDQTSSNGGTPRTALTDIVITDGDPNIDISRYNNNIEKGFQVTSGNLAYELCDEDIELLCAIVSAESDKSYDDALAVVSTILNRCEDPTWIALYGRDPIAHATAPDQYVVYQHGSYEKYMNSNAPEEVVQAVKDALAGVRNHNYCSFRSNSFTSYSDNMITSTGNRYL